MRKITAILSICLVAMFMAPALGMSLFGAVALFGALSFMPSGSEGSAAFAGLNKEIWLPEIMEGFYVDGTFVSEARDLSAFVSNNTINLAEAGANPEVLLNNTTYPIPYAQRADIPLALPLETLDTENTIVYNIEAAELSYDKRKSVQSGHIIALNEFSYTRAAYNWSPTTNSLYTPLLQTTGLTDGEGRRAMTFKDLSRLKRKFTDAKIPTQGRILVLTAKHMEDLENEDIKLYDKMLDKGMVYGFKIYEMPTSDMPRYNHTTGVKVAWGAASAATDSHASIAFHKDEVMRCKGTADMFVREKDPELRADMVGFQMRNLTLPMRNKAIAAIYSPVLP
jgi:hypothetical protein